MGKGGKSGTSSNQPEETVIDWDEVKQHATREDSWIVVEDGVYNVTQWFTRHPGGSKVIRHYVGQDATEPFRAFHNDLNYVKKYLKPLRVGRIRTSGIPDVVDGEEKTVVKEQQEKISLKQDFEELRKNAVEMGLFKSRPIFFIGMLAHIILFEVLAYLSMRCFGTSWIPYLLSIACYTIVQGQASWLQHDFGHLSVFKTSGLDHFFHGVTMGLIKGASPKWWSHMHFQHHSKPNIMEKDPDVQLQPFFVIGEKMPWDVASRQTAKKIPYHFQHLYFFLIGPPLLLPLYFQIMTFRHVFKWRCYSDIMWLAGFFLKLFFLYTPLLGFWHTLLYYFIVRVLESHWFTWVSQSNHIPMDIKPDTEEAWVPLQIHATCNVEQSSFNDWFTGHLNFQIEHHLFPTMPRHNYHKIQPYVRQLCAKHNIPFHVKPLWVAFKDVVKSLKKSGEIYHTAYEARHVD